MLDLALVGRDEGICKEQMGAPVQVLGCVVGKSPSCN